MKSYSENPYSLKNTWTPIKSQPDLKNIRAMLNEKSFDEKGIPRTFMDVPNFPKNCQTKEILKWIEANVGYAGESSLPMLEEYSHNFKETIKNQFGLVFPESYVDKGFNQNFKNEKKFVDFIKSLTDKRINTMTASLNLVLTKGIWTEHIFKKEEFQNIENETEYMYNKLFEVLPGERVPRLIKLSGLEHDVDWGEVQIKINETDIIHANMGVRGKNPGRTKEKMILKPEFNPSEAITDGSAIRLEVQSLEDVEKLVPFFAQFIQKNFNAKEISLKNNALLQDQKTTQKFKQICRRNNISFKPKDNTNSNKNFGSLNILSKIEVPGKKGTIRTRPLEIQFVLLGNQNESGRSHHKIYETIQKINGASRLFGVLPNGWIHYLAQMAQQHVDYRDLEPYFLESTIKVYPNYQSNNIAITAQKYHERIFNHLYPGIKSLPITKKVTKKWNPNPGARD